MAAYNAATSFAGSGVDPSQIAAAYKSGDYTKTNQLISQAGMSEQGATNTGGNMGYSPADISEMKSKGIVFAAAGTPAEDAGWDSNATSGNGPAAASGVINKQLNPNSVPAATTTMLGATTPWNVTPDQTVQGRIASIIDPNSSLMQQAQTQANEMSNQRGLVNSSMAVTGGQDAMYRAATPIATADAATAAKAAGYNADERNQFDIKNADNANQMAQANLGANTQMYGANLSAKTQVQTANISADTQKSITAMNNDTQQKLGLLDATTKTQIQQLQNANSTLLSTNQQASQAFNQYVAAAANIENNPNMDAATKNAAMQALWQTTQTQLTVLANVSGLNLTADLNMTQFSPFTPPATPAPVSDPSTSLVAGT